MSDRRRQLRRLPAPLVSGQCMICGRRLVKTERGGWLHEENGQIRCPSGQAVCMVCDLDGLVQCSTQGCENMSHPSCSIYCECCGRPKCRVHARPDGLCHACSSRPAGQHGHESEESQW